MPTLTHRPINSYFAAFDRFAHHNITYETVVRAAFQALLKHCARQACWTLVPEHAASPRRTIVNDPNRPHDPQHTLRRIAKAITISLETLPIMQSLPELGIVEEEIDSRVPTGF